MRARALAEREVDRGRVEHVLAGCGISADVDALCAGLLRRSRVTLNFHPDRRIPDGRTVAQALRDDGVYRNQFETGISNGGLTAFAGGDRDEWERRLFKGAYHADDASGEAVLRPKYGGLNLAGFTNGPAPAFGSCALVLGPDEAARTTFLFGDSSERWEDIGTADAFEPVLAALFERVASTGQMLGLKEVTVRELVELLSGGAPRPQVFTRVLDDYVETHTHGPVSLSSAADLLLLDPCYRETPTADALLQAARRHTLSVRWHEGTQLTLSTFPTDTPVGRHREPTRWERLLLSGRAAELAERVVTHHADDGTHLTAAAIGGATQAFLQRPEAWRQWGAPDPSLTVFKDLWRILVAHGAPARLAR